MNQTGLVLASVGVLLGLLIQGRIAPSVLFTGTAVVYFLTGLLPQGVLLGSYSNPALATLVLLLLVSVALERSSLLEHLTDRLLDGKPMAATWRFTSVAAALSAFLANTAVVAVLLGIVTRQRKLPPSRLLLPLSYASILGGVTTLVGTSTNLTVNSLVVGAGLPALGMFQLAWVGVPAAVLCLGALAWLSRHLPVREAATRDPEAAGYFLEARVNADSPLAGRTIEQNRLRALDGLFLLEIIRDGRLRSPVGPDEVIQAGDCLIFTGALDRVSALREFRGLTVFEDGADALLGSNLVEVVIASQSELDKKTLRDVDFRTLFDAGVVGIRRGEERLTGQLGRIPLAVGDCLLLAVGPDFRNRHNLERNFHVLGEAPLATTLDARRSAAVLAGFGAVVAAAATGVLPLFHGLLVFLAALLGFRVLTFAQLRRRFPFDLFFLVGSSLAVAHVLDSTGGAELVAGLLGGLFEGMGVWGAFAGVYVLTVVLTELVSNNAAAALAFPVAIATAKLWNVDATPFVLAVTYGASAGFVIPFGYQTHLMVYSAGRYRLGDFVRLGLPVSVLFGAVVLILTPMVFPFTRALH